MGSKDYQIVFRGRVAPGHDEATARANMAKLFKVDAERVDQLFSGGRQVLKRGLDRESADRYRGVLRKAGVIVSIVSVATEESAQKFEAPVAKEPPPPPPGDTANRATFAIDDPSAEPAPQKAVFQVDDPAIQDAALTHEIGIAEPSHLHDVIAEQVGDGAIHQRALELEQHAPRGLV